MTTVLSILTTIKAALQGATWPASANKIFAGPSVLITPGPDEQMLSSLRVPICLIRPLDAAYDPEFNEEPNLINQSVGVRLISMAAGDATGQNAMLGANLTGGVTQSKGRGILEIEQQMISTIQFLNAANGITIQFRNKSEIASVIDDALGYIAYRDYVFEFWGTEI